MFNQSGLTDSGLTSLGWPEPSRGPVEPRFTQDVEPLLHLEPWSEFSQLSRRSIKSMQLLSFVGFKFQASISIIPMFADQTPMNDAQISISYGSTSISDSKPTLSDGKITVFS